MFLSVKDNGSASKLRNQLHTLLLQTLLSAYPALVIWMIWGGSLLIWLGLAIGFFLFFTPVYSSQLVMRMMRGRLLTRSEAPVLYRIVDQLSDRAKLVCTPDLYLLPGRQLNAMAVGGKNDMAIGVTQDLVRLLDKSEIEAVVAHEIGHLANNDIRVMTLAALSARLTRLFSGVAVILLLFSLPLIVTGSLKLNWLALLFLLFAPQLSAVAQLGLSRVREFQADIMSADLIGSSEPLIRALIMIEQNQRLSWQQRLLLKSMPAYLRTHPSTAERVRRLKEYAPGRYRRGAGPTIVLRRDQTQAWKPAAVRIRSDGRSRKHW